MVNTKKVVNLRWERFKRNIIKQTALIKRSIYNAMFNSNSSNIKSKKGTAKSGKAKNK